MRQPKFAMGQKVIIPLKMISEKLGLVKELKVVGTVCGVRYDPRRGSGSSEAPWYFYEVQPRFSKYAGGVAEKDIEACSENQAGRCPSGHIFGTDCDKYSDCDDCKIFNECSDTLYTDKTELSPQSPETGTFIKEPECPFCGARDDMLFSASAEWNSEKGVFELSTVFLKPGHCRRCGSKIEAELVFKREALHENA